MGYTKEQLRCQHKWLDQPELKQAVCLLCGLVAREAEELGESVLKPWLREINADTLLPLLKPGQTYLAIDCATGAVSIRDKSES